MSDRNNTNRQFGRHLSQSTWRVPFLWVGILVIAGMVLLVRPGLAQKKSGPTDLASERRKYAEEIAAALEPVQKRYVTRLTASQKSRSRKGRNAGEAASETA